jgi:hypothetical protein
VTTPLTDMMSATPLSVFSDHADSPRDVLIKMFGGDSLIEQSLTCGVVTGVWVDGWVAILPTPDGWVGTYVPDAPASKEWVKASRGSRIAWLDVSLATPLTEPCKDLVGVAVECIRGLGRYRITGWDVRLGDSVLGGMGNFQPPRYVYGWLLRMALAYAAISSVERERVWTVLALAAHPGEAQTARALVETLNCLDANQSQESAAEELLLRIIRERTGTDLPSADDLLPAAPPVALLAHPRSQWQTLAVQMLEASSLLTPPPPPAGGTSPAKGWPIAA